MGLTSGWVARVDRPGAVVIAAIALWGVAPIGIGPQPSLWLAVRRHLDRRAADVADIGVGGACRPAGVGGHRGDRRLWCGDHRLRPGAVAVAGLAVPGGRRRR